MYRYYNPNPFRDNAGDCTVRAITKATKSNWIITYLRLCITGLLNGDMPSSNFVWGEHLRKLGYKKHSIESITVLEFSEKHQRGTFILCTGSHVVCCENGTYYDTWNSGKCIIIYYFERND